MLLFMFHFIPPRKDKELQQENGVFRDDWEPLLFIGKPSQNLCATVLTIVMLVAVAKDNSNGLERQLKSFRTKEHKL